MQGMDAMDLGRVVVAGLGRSGAAAASYCASRIGERTDGAGGPDGVRVDSVTVYAGPRSESSEAVAGNLAGPGLTVIFDSEDVEGSYDLAIVSPGIPQPSNFYTNVSKAAGGNIVSEPDLAYRVSPGRWIGITGTNGKTTATSLTEHVIASCGVSAVACGNIGLPCIEAAEGASPGTFKVAELSSFQLSSMPTFDPVAAVLLNITPDHVEWHGDLESYARAKVSIFSHQESEDHYAIVDCTSENTLHIACKLAATGHSVVCIGGPEGFHHRFHPDGCEGARGGSAWCEGGRMVVEIDGVRHELVDEADLPIKGLHNLQNALAAAAACVVAGMIDPAIDDAGIVAGLLSYRAVEHRLEPAGEVGGIRFCNDSKATNTDAARKALTAFPNTRVVMMLGGYDKGTELCELVSDCMRSCSAVVCFGEAADRFFSAFEDAVASDNGIRTRVLRTNHMSDAFVAAVGCAEPGDVVLLSPACSSYDEFGSYEERGAAFKQMVADLSARGEVNGAGVAGVIPR